jgi:di/tricarboxylate transporter
MTPETLLVEPTFHTWVVYGLIGAVLVLYAIERVPMEVTSLVALCALLVFFHAFPVRGPDGAALLPAERLLAGFGNPALIAVLALLVIGQGMVRTGILDRGADLVTFLGGGRMWPSIVAALLVVLAVSGFLNNIPVVVIFIPIMQGLAARFGLSASRVMMPLSFAAVLGGMTTLIGSGTNLLVNSALIGMGETPFGFFDFSIPGVVLAAAGLVFTLVVVSRLLPDRAPLTQSLFDGAGKQFIAQIAVGPDSRLIGTRPVGGLFPTLKNMTVRMVQRGEEALLPPFEDLEVRPGDVLVVAATRQALTDALQRDQGLLFPDLEDGSSPDHPDNPWQRGDAVLAEVMVAPASRMVGLSLRLIGFRHRTRCIVLGIQRRARMYRERMTQTRLEPGDVLLVQGQHEDLRALRGNPDVVVLSGSRTELPALHRARRAVAIFLAVVVAAASGVVPIVIAALSGAAAMVAAGVLNLRQASRAIDSKLVTMIPAALALGTAMHETGGAAYLAHGMIALLRDAGPVVVLSGFFLTMALLTNIISSKAMAVLFTPIAVDAARELGVDPHAFAIAVVFAANCAFATPIGYQTSLLVMGPGHYTFRDFVRAGLPLVIFVWLAFTLFAPWYYGL